MASSEDFGGWIADPHYRRFDTMREMLLRATGGKRGRILDIGFLTYLGDSWQRFGVSARRSSEDRDFRCSCVETCVENGTACSVSTL